MQIRILVLISFFAVFQVHGQKKIKVLFVGNSLTYYNNLPEIVKQVAALDSVQLTYEMIALPNYALVDHLAENKVQSLITAGNFDFVVVQQGPSSQADGLEYLLNAAFPLSNLCKKKKAGLVFYMVWPSKSRMQDFAGVYRHYKIAADTTQSIFSPAGSAWQEAWKISPGLTLYGADNFHPSYEGSLLAAMVVYGSISKKKALTFLDYRHFKSENVPQPDFDAMVTAAEIALKGK